MVFEAVIGMEVHAELSTQTKMFCGCLNDPDEKEPNKNICPVCMGHPGTLPTINKKAVESVVRVGLALNCRIAENSHFDRKNYFYPDLPKGYQISQYAEPLCEEGFLVAPGSGARIRIRRIHLEEDTGRLIHPEKKEHTLVDYNRAGVPLMELVTEPDIRTAADARKFCEELQLILRYLGVSEANMEKGEMRCEVNLSLCPVGSTAFGTKVEVKNLNSFKVVEKAITYEIKRQTAVLKKGEKVVQETLGWDDAKGATFSQRAKEEAHDYRYFPEPDLPPLHFEKDVVEELRRSLLELPQARRQRYEKEYGLTEDQVGTLTVAKHLGGYFESVASELQSEHRAGEYRAAEGAGAAKDPAKHFTELAKLSANYLINELPRALSAIGARLPVGQGSVLGGDGASFDHLKVTPENFAEFIIRIEKGVISSHGAKEVLRRMVETGADPDEIIRDSNLAQVSDTGELEVAARAVLKNSPKVVEDFRSGKQNALQFLVGQVMKETKGKANPKVVQEVLQRLLGGVY